VKHIHIVNPYKSVAMLRMAGPLTDDLPKLYTVTEGIEVDTAADLNIHFPYHSLVEDKDFGTGKHIAVYTHCNPGALPELMQACARADIVTAMSFEGRQELLNFGVDPKKVWVIPCAADNFSYRPRRVLIVGYPQPNGRKRESILLDLAFQYDLTAFEFYLAGDGWEHTAAQLAALGVRRQVVDSVDDEILVKFYQMADVFLVTGYMEGGPLPLLEAMANGTKVLSPRFGYAADYLSDEEIYTDVADLMKKLSDLAEPSIYNHQLARSWSWKDYTAEYALLLGRLLGESVDLYPERGMSRYAQLLDVIDEVKPKSICEIGTWNGNRAIQMLQQAGKFHSMHRIHYQGFDLFEQQTGEQFVRELSKVGHPLEVVRKRIEATGAKIELVAGETYDSINNMKPADFYFVDGGHSEETIQNDGERVSSYIDEHGGVAVFDDYYHEGQPEGMGCNKLIDALDLDIYEVTPLPALTKAADGRLIGMVKVRQKDANIHLQRRAAQAGSGTWYFANSSYPMPDMLRDYAPSAPGADGELERTTAPRSEPPPETNAEMAG